MCDQSRFSQVSSLYGPGTVAGWLCIVFSVLVTWTINGNDKRRDAITNDYVTCLSLPVIAAGHVLYGIHSFNGNVRDLLTSTEDGVIRSSAAIEAPLNICETFSVFALLLFAVSALRRQYKRSTTALIVGLFSFSTEIVLLSGFRGVKAADLNTARPFAFSIEAMMVAILTVLGVLLVTYVACVVAGRILSQRAEPHSPSRSSEVCLQHPEIKCAQATAVFLPFSLACSCFSGAGILVNTVYGAHSSVLSRVLYFIPKPSASIRDLDQAVALGAGLITLAFSIYSAIQSSKNEELEEFNKWKQIKQELEQVILAYQQQILEAGREVHLNPQTSSLQHIATV